MPFRVSLGNNQTVEVLGTHFNINSYTDEQEIKTTLLEGKVKIVTSKSLVLLMPGQQAQFDKLEQIKVISDPDLDAALAWKNGYFIFKKESIGTIMRQISRWYDVEVEYEGEPIIKRFYSKFPRNVTVSAVFESLEATGSVHFKIQDKKIVVTR